MSEISDYQWMPHHPWLKQLLVWVLVAGLLLCLHDVQGQQAYNERDQDGYQCTKKLARTPCNTFVVYRALDGDSIKLIANRFLVSRDQIANASNISDGQRLLQNQPVLIPITNCSCVGGRSQYNVTYVIQEGDTFFLVSTSTFEGLTTFQAAERANPSVVPNRLQLGEIVILPIRCACPSTDQSSKGVQLLVTYPISASDTLLSISSAWNISSNDFLSANELQQNSSIAEDTTLLLPFTQMPQLPSLLPSPPSAPPPPPPPPPVPPTPSPSPAPITPCVPSGSNSKTGLIVGAACGMATLLAIVLLFLIWLIFRKRKRHRSFNQTRHDEVISHSSQIEIADLGKPKRDNLKGEILTGMSELVDTDRPIWYSLEELQKATDDFSAAYLIHGSVYRGLLSNRAVAIKKMKGGMSQELKILCKVHHSNLIKLLGISVNEEDHVYLVYELAENGSLSVCLHNKSPPSKSSVSSSSSTCLRWNMRLQIALDVASALEYIHDYTKPSFVHKDIKSSNILLDENFRAKVANFGMAKLAANVGAAPILTKHIAGTQGYMAPEYLAHGIVTPKLDVYAYGVILLEVLSGQKAIMRSIGGGQLPGREQFLSATIGPILDSDQKMEMLGDWMDPDLQDAYPPDCALQVAVLARSCVDDDPVARPSMKDITYILSKLFQISLEWEASGNRGRSYIDLTLEGR